MHGANMPENEEKKLLYLWRIKLSLKNSVEFN